jgi:hypothetical protein
MIAAPSLKSKRWTKSGCEKVQSEVIAGVSRIREALKEQKRKPARKN